MILLFIISITVWVAIDSYKRKNNVILWPLGSALLVVIVAPIYFAKRNLKKGESREGGTGWNVLKNFALLWTIIMAGLLILGLLSTGEIMNESTSDFETAGAAIGSGLGLMVISMMWFFPIAGALALGMFIKKSSYIENGPTGKLSETYKKDNDMDLLIEELEN